MIVRTSFASLIFYTADSVEITMLVNLVSKLKTSSPLGSRPMGVAACYAWTFSLALAFFMGSAHASVVGEVTLTIGKSNIER